MENKPIRKTYWTRHYTGYAFAHFTDGWHVADWKGYYSKSYDDNPPLAVLDSREKALEWCNKHSKVPTRADHHENAIKKAIAYLEKEGYTVTKRSE